MSAALKEVETISLFVEDLAAARTFYADVFGREVIYEDAACAVFRFGDLQVNVLQASEAPELVAPLPVAGPGAGARFMLTILVADVDAVCADLARRGVRLLNGPIDRPWGRRTAAFPDPAGHVWEIAQSLPA